MTSIRSPSTIKSWRESFIKDHNKLILLQVILIPVVPFLFVLIQAIIWPGFIYCEETSCPSSYNPSVPDSATIPIVLVLYTYCSCLSIAITTSSGAWMQHAFWNKLITIAILIVMTFSICLLISPAAYRGFVIPYHSVQNYQFNVSRTGDSTATVVVENLWSDYIDGRSFLMEVREINSGIQDLQQVSPLSQCIFCDSYFSDTTLLERNTSVTRYVTNLQNNQWYVWILIPAYNAVGNAAVGTYLSLQSSITTRNGNITNIYLDAYLDLRSFKICQWDQDMGCEQSIH